MVSTNKSQSMRKAYHLFTAYDSNDTQGLDAMLLCIKSRPVLLRAHISKHNVRMDVRVEVFPTSAVILDTVLERRDGLGVARGATAPIICRTALDAIAVDIHVDELSFCALEINHIVVLQMIAAVDISYDDG